MGPSEGKILTIDKLSLNRLHTVKNCGFYDLTTKGQKSYCRIFKGPNFQKSQKLIRPKNSNERKLIRPIIWPKNRCGCTHLSAIFSLLDNNWAI